MFLFPNVLYGNKELFQGDGEHFSSDLCTAEIQFTLLTIFLSILTRIWLGTVSRSLEPTVYSLKFVLLVPNSLYRNEELKCFRKLGNTFWTTMYRLNSVFLGPINLFRMRNRARSLGILSEPKFLVPCSNFLVKDEEQWVGNTFEQPEFCVPCTTKCQELFQEATWEQFLRQLRTVWAMFLDPFAHYLS